MPSTLTLLEAVSGPVRPQFLTVEVWRLQNDSLGARCVSHAVTALSLSRGTS